MCRRLALIGFLAILLGSCHPLYYPGPVEALTVVERGDAQVTIYGTWEPELGVSAAWMPVDRVALMASAVASDPFSPRGTFFNETQAWDAGLGYVYPLSTTFYLASYATVGAGSHEMADSIGRFGFEVALNPTYETSSARFQRYGVQGQIFGRTVGRSVRIIGGLAARLRYVHFTDFRLCETDSVDGWPTDTLQSYDGRLNATDFNIAMFSEFGPTAWPIVVQASLEISAASSTRLELHAPALIARLGLKAVF